MVLVERRRERVVWDKLRGRVLPGRRLDLTMAELGEMHASAVPKEMTVGIVGSDKDALAWQGR